MDIDEPIDNSIDLRNQMLDHLSLNNEAHFKSQQINDPDLTTSEKRQIAESLLQKNPGSFLSRFGKYLLADHLEFFSELATDDYEVNYYLQEFKSRVSKTSNKTTVRNRRLEALRRLTAEGKYFSDEEMRKRNPIMFEHFVGQYLTEEEKRNVQANNCEAQSFLGFLLNAIEEREIEEKIKDGTVEEEETDSDEEDENYKVKEKSIQLWGECLPTKVECRKKDIKIHTALTDKEKKVLMNEFRSQVFSEFIGGKDTDFDYSKVDLNHDYDDLEMLEIDQQDEYFDSETPEILSKGDASSDSSVSFDPPRSLTQKMDDLGK